MKKIGFFGAGNMGSALMNGMKGLDIRIGVFDVSHDAMQRAAQIGAQTFDTARELAAWSDLLVCCVKPQYFASLLAMLPTGAEGTPVASIVAGISTQRLQEAFPGSPVLRIMPNTPAMIGEGMIAFSLSTSFSEQDKLFTCSLFESAGKVAWVQEAQMDAVTALSGSGPAFVYLMIEALTEAGVREGLFYDTAAQLAAQTVLGSAKMVLESDAHPAQLRAQVTSPAGTTAEGLYCLEKAGFKAALLDAVHAAAQRSRALGNER